MRVIELKETASTNDYLLSLNTGEEVVAVADYQNAGRGMGENKWESESGCNLLFSMLLHPAWLKPADQFLMSMAHALAISDVLSRYTDGISIKWPNDIYWRDRKISGTLIDGSIKGGFMCNMVIGTGININQREFRSDAPNPVSLLQITGKEHDRRAILEEIIARNTYYHDIARAEYAAAGHSDTIVKAYHDRLYRRNGIYRYEDAEGPFFAELVRVQPNGIMILRKADGTTHHYEVKEVRYLLSNG